MKLMYFFLLHNCNHFKISVTTKYNKMQVWTGLRLSVQMAHKKIEASSECTIYTKNIFFSSELNTALHRSTF